VKWTLKRDRAPLIASRLSNQRKYPRTLRPLSKRSKPQYHRRAARPSVSTGRRSDAFETHEADVRFQCSTFHSGLTRVVSFKLSSTASEPHATRTAGTTKGFPSGVTPWRPRSQNILDCNLINLYHIAMCPYFLYKLRRNTPETAFALSSRIRDQCTDHQWGDPNIHNSAAVPLLSSDTACGTLDGNIALKAPDGTRWAGIMLTLMHKLGLNDSEDFGDSTGPFARQHLGTIDAP